MDQKILATSLAPEVFIDEVGGDLQVKGWERSEVVVRAQEEELQLSQAEDTLHLSCQDGCLVRLPHGSTLHVGVVHGNARFKLLEDTLTIVEIFGELTLSEAADTQIKTVHGNLMGKRISGDLQVGQVDGNVYVKNIQGDCRLDRVDGNLELKRVGGDVVSRVAGNAGIFLDALGGSDYTVEAEGNIYCRIPRDADARVVLHSEGENIQVRLTDDEKNYQQAEYERVLGEGKSQIRLSAAGNITLVAYEADWVDEESTPGEGPGLPDDFGQRISEQVKAQIDAQMEAMARQLDAQMERLSSMVGRAGLSANQAERVVENARAASERATTQAQEKIRRAQERLERKLEAVRQRNEARARASENREQARTRRSWGSDRSSTAVPSVPQQPAKPQATDEERLAILRMLEQKKITIEEAEKLLSALES